MNQKFECWVIKMENGWETDDREVRVLNYQEANDLSDKGYKIIAFNKVE